MYLMPPLEEVLVGDVVKGTAGDRTGHWVVLSPSCDLEQGKVEYVLIAAAEPLDDLREVIAWRQGLPDPSGQRTSELSAVLRNNRAKGQAERYHFLPGALSLPDLLVDFQSLHTIDRASFDGLARIASLDSPFAEVIANRFIRHYSRLGTPDVDTTPTVERLRLMGPLVSTESKG
jgi:hypothetical protein